MSKHAQPFFLNHHELNSLIDDFAGAVAQYLSPVVRYVGHNDRYFDALRKQFSGVILEESYSGLPAHLVVFDQPPQELLSKGKLLSPDSSYVFFVDRKPDFDDEIRGLLKNRISITLLRPTIKALLWHIRALLLLRDVSYSNSSHSFPALMSIDVGFRQAVNDLIEPSQNLQSAVACFPSASLRDAVDDLLFGSLPRRQQPHRFPIEHLDVNSLHADRINLLVSSVSDQLKLPKLLSVCKRVLRTKPTIVLIDCVDAAEHYESATSGFVHFPTLESRYSDALLIAYWCAAFKSCDLDTPQFYSDRQVQGALDASGHDPVAYLSELLAVVPEKFHVGDDLSELIDNFERFSIDDVLGATQLKVLQILKGSSVIDAASTAAGIPTVTYYKRMKRITDKTSLLSIFDDAQKSK